MGSRFHCPSIPVLRCAPTLSIGASQSEVQFETKISHEIPFEIAEFYGNADGGTELHFWMSCPSGLKEGLCVVLKRN
jgi:hypothetical protein